MISSKHNNGKRLTENALLDGYEGVKIDGEFLSTVNDNEFLWHYCTFSGKSISNRDEADWLAYQPEGEKYYTKISISRRLTAQQRKVIDGL